MIQLVRGTSAARLKAPPDTDKVGRCLRKEGRLEDMPYLSNLKSNVEREEGMSGGYNGRLHSLGDAQVGPR